MRAPTDASVIAESLEEGEAFFAIFERHFAALNRYLRRRLNSETADELTRDVFAVALARRRSFESRAAGRVAVVVRDRVEPASEPAACGAAGASAGCWDRGGCGRCWQRAAEIVLPSSVEPSLARALLALSPEDRDVLLLFAWGELGYEEISRALDLPVGTVSSPASAVATPSRKSGSSSTINTRIARRLRSCSTITTTPIRTHAARLDGRTSKVTHPPPFCKSVGMSCGRAV